MHFPRAGSIDCAPRVTWSFRAETGRPASAFTLRTILGPAVRRWINPPVARVRVFGGELRGVIGLTDGAPLKYRLPSES